MELGKGVLRLKDYDGKKENIWEMWGSQVESLASRAVREKGGGSKKKGKVAAFSLKQLPPMS